ncbi:MAG: hypothetical protein KC501_41440, partial [Myxococcales bacterium]|nr:hypothetical protein [Myxococcales bacterium]
DGAVPALLGCLEAARSAVAELARALGLEALPLPRAALRCDVAAPWEVELGPDDARAVRRTLRSFTRHHDRHGIQGPLLRAATRHMLGEGSSLAHVVPARVLAATDGPASWGELADALGREPELRERCERAARHLARDQAELRLPADGRDQGPSLAALHASPTARSGDGLLVHGLGLDATASYARLADLLDATDPTREGLGPWFRRQHHRLAEHTGVDVAVLLHDHGVPNVMAQPELGALVLDPWGVTPGQLPDRGLRMRRDPERVAPLIEVDGHPRPLVAYAPTAAAVPFDDPCLQALLLSSGHVPPLAAAGTTLVHEPERGRPRHSPRLCLPDDTVVRPRSTWLEGEALRALTRAKSLARFARWQALAAEHQWPRLVTLERDAGPALLVDRDSPLAIEAAFEGTARARRIKVQELLRDAWIGADDDDDDRRYLADLVLPFVRDLDPSSLHVDDDALDPARRGPGAEAGLAAAQ